MSDQERRDHERRLHLPRDLDVRRPLDADLVGAFDLFHCDPVETLEGIRLFLSRGCSGLLGVGAVACFGLTAIEASRRPWGPAACLDCASGSLKRVQSDEQRVQLLNVSPPAPCTPPPTTP